MSKRMNKERAREIFKSLGKCLSDNEAILRLDEKDIKELTQALDIAIESLDNEWVDVRDRLPSESEIYDVLATIDFGNYRYVQIMNCEDNIFYFNNGGWSDDSNTDKVIAWKPLPEPYKRKE